MPHVALDHPTLVLPGGGAGGAGGGGGGGGGSGGGGGGYEAMGGAQPYGSPIGSPANTGSTGSPWAASSPVSGGCTDDLMTIAMPQGSAMDKEQIAARLRAAAPTEYED
mmetsp:Transcript_26207/g.65987  ORF Transcript_26207/g.65987 Transcript_26207/m.65987 type:complete len:109 (-) Transcript_26207:221-547(-)